MPTLPESPPSPAVWLQRGQALEGKGRFTEAVGAYDWAIDLLGSDTDPLDTPHRRTLGLVWMNRGNALQKIASTAALRDAVRSYDQAIVVFQTLPLDAEPALRNHLGAAWLNRGHALMTTAEPSAVDSFEQAIMHLEKLPLEADPHYQLNLAGAWTNLAHALLAPASLPARERARTAAHSALGVLTHVERAHDAFAAMSLRARRALVMALGDLLSAAEKARQPIANLASEATDAIDDGLAIAREFEARDVTQLRSLAVRLFRMGAQLYSVHQPQFLGEFVLENLGPLAFGTDPEFCTIANDALARTLAHLQRPQILVAGALEAEKLVAAARSLRAAQKHVSALIPPLSTSPSFA